MWYARKGFPAAGGVPCGAEPPPLVGQYLDLRVRRKEGAEWESVTIDDSLRGIVVLNLQSYGGEGPTQRCVLGFRVQVAESLGGMAKR